jgi:proteasome-associated ATPase
MIDPAILRAGRLDVKVRIDRPGREAARAILRLTLKPDVPLDPALLAEHDGDRQAATSALVDLAVARVYDEGPESEFLEVRYTSGATEILHFHDFSSGAMLASIVARAKRLAIKRRARDQGDGLRTGDIEAAVSEEFRENEDLPSTANPEDWARVSGRRGEPIIAVRPLVGARSGGGGAGDA